MIPYLERGIVIALTFTLHRLLMNTSLLKFPFLLDIHTHRLATVPGESVQCVEPSAFAPISGCYYSVGIHPWKAHEAFQDEALWTLLEEIAVHPQVLAIGEAGLDKCAVAPLAVQQTVFERQIALSEIVEKPLVIHAVKAMNELVVLKRRFRPRMPWIVHGFRNKESVARMLLNEGILLSFGARFPEAVVQALPASQLLVETDESSESIQAVIARLAAVRGEPVDVLLPQLATHARRIFFERESCEFR